MSGCSNLMFMPENFSKNKVDKKRLKTGLTRNYLGRMFPTKSEIRFGLFTDEALYLEQIQKCSFWYQNSFHGVDLTSLKAEATRETFSQPVVVIVFPC